MISCDGYKDRPGFTLIELVMVIVIIGVLAVTVAVKWPTGMKEAAAVLDFIHAVRYAQHLALTRQYTTPAAAWGIIVAGNQYSVKRADDSETGDPEYQAHDLPGNTTISAGSVWFNGLGEPIDDATGTPLAADTSFVIGSTTVTVSQETGYVE